MPVRKTEPKEEPEVLQSSVFATLNAVNVGDHTEKKNGLTYLSWAWAWSELLKRYPDSSYTIYENKDGLFYHTDGKTAWVKTGVTVEGKECIEFLPVMDYKNRSIPVESITSFDVNKAIQRSLTKAVARHGLGLYIYAGEDLPEETPTAAAKAPAAPKTPEHTQETAELASKIKERLDALSTTMSPDAKRDLANTKIIPVIGSMNYMSCKDATKLQTVLDSLPAA